MKHEIIKELFYDQLKTFEYVFTEQSEKIFKNGKKLIHPAEFGHYREKCTKHLLEFIIDDNKAVGDGFIVNPKNEISTQCDIVVYDKNTPKFIKDNFLQFFPSECVFAVGEIKSGLTKSEFKVALRKLSNIKKMCQTEDSKARIKEYNSIFSFLICKNVQFDLRKVDFDDIYKGIDNSFRHNFILILKKGCYTYQMVEEDFKNNTFLDKETIDSFTSIKTYCYPTFTVKINDIETQRFNVSSLLLTLEHDSADLIALFIRHLITAIELHKETHFNVTSYYHEDFKNYYLEIKD